MLPVMDRNHAARCLEKLGNPTRLEIFRLLVRAGAKGLAVGELQAHLNIPASTLSHHVAQLVNVGLVAQERQGRLQQDLNGVGELAHFRHAVFFQLLDAIYRTLASR